MSLRPIESLRPTGLRSFRSRLLVAMMLVVSALTLVGIFIAQQRAAEDAKNDFERDFQVELAARHRLQDLRNAAVADRSAAFARNARIHAALEDNAIDLLYPSAQEELRDLLRGTGGPNGLHARFYRFLDGAGAVIPAPSREAGMLAPNEEAELAHPGLPQEMQLGYLPRADGAIEEMIAVPIRSTETGEVIAALVLGFHPVEATRDAVSGMRSGILVQGKLQLQNFAPAAEAQIVHQLEQAPQAQSVRVSLGDQPFLLFSKRLNPKSNYPPAFEVCVYPLARLEAQQKTLRTQILSVGGALLLLAFFISHGLARRLSQPVEKLAVVSEQNLAHRQQAEAKLLTTTEELQRSARFSADASHQLKSPITVLRAGLDSLLSREGLAPETYEEIAALIHQTYRLTGVVEDLLLLSRMDAGRLRLDLHAVDLAQLVAMWIEDLRAVPEANDLQLKSDLPAALRVAGEKKYTNLVVQNLLENARKYNHRGGTIRVSARVSDRKVELHIANTGRGIPPAAQPYIFERFHRAGGGEDVPGHGLGLNLARELMRLHGGELLLVRSDAEWTEFCASFTAAS